MKNVVLILAIMLAVGCIKPCYASVPEGNWCNFDEFVMSPKHLSLKVTDSVVKINSERASITGHLRHDEYGNAFIQLDKRLTEINKDNSQSAITRINIVDGGMETVVDGEVGAYYTKCE